MLLARELLSLGLVARGGLGRVVTGVIVVGSELGAQPVEIDAVAGVFQLASYLRLLGLGSTSPHICNPLARAVLTLCRRRVTDYAT